MEQNHSVKGFVSGRVQGVGFRYFVKRQAHAERVHGYAHNLPDGRVEFLLQGEPAAVARVIERIRIGPNYARVTELVVEPVEVDPARTGFDIR
jgi:acylphosphatase